MCVCEYAHCNALYNILLHATENSEYYLYMCTGMKCTCLVPAHRIWHYTSDMCGVQSFGIEMWQ